MGLFSLCFHYGTPKIFFGQDAWKMDILRKYGAPLAWDRACHRLGRLPEIPHMHAHITVIYQAILVYSYPETLTKYVIVDILGFRTTIPRSPPPTQPTW